MLFTTFADVFNKMIFESSKSYLLEKVAEKPERYIGIFRPTKPRGKILQNLFYSHEIRFGDAFEKITEMYLIENGFTILPKKIQSLKGDDLSLDQCFEAGGIVYLVEQKIRDDHDSTKKKGQITNFEIKLNTLKSIFSDKTVVGIMFFVDDALRKNKNYYTEQLAKITEDYGTETHLFYGKPFCDYLQIPNVWVEIVDYLKCWRASLRELPEINFDLNAAETFAEIKLLEPAVFRKLFANKEIFEQIILTLFPTKETLKLLLQHFQTQEGKIYQTLSSQLTELLK